MAIAACSAAGCSRPQAGLDGEPPGPPFPRSAVVRTWSLSPGLTLAEVKAPDLPPTPPTGVPAWVPWARAWDGTEPVLLPSAFYLADRQGWRLIVGPGVRAQVQSARPDLIEFWCRGADGLPRGVPFLAFPYLLTCDPASGRTVETALYLSLEQPVAFGGWSSGHLLAGLDLDPRGLVARFAFPSPGWPPPVRPCQGSAALGPAPRLWTAPPCAVRWLPDRRLLSLRFAGTGAVPGLASQAASLAGRHPLVSGVLVRPDPEAEGTEVLLQVEPPAEYNAVCDFGESRTVALNIRRPQAP